MNLEDIEELSPFHFEKLIGKALCNIGFDVKNISLGEDVGIDVLATKDNETLGIQVKKYINRKVNLEIIYHTYGASAFYDCSRAIVVTLGELTGRASEVANKLNVEIWDKDKVLELVELSAITNISFKNEDYSDDNRWFYDIWNSDIKNLESKAVKYLVKEAYANIIKVDNDGIVIINSKGNRRSFSIDTFRRMLTNLRDKGSLTRSEIDDDFKGRGSSAISAVLASIPQVIKDNSSGIIVLKWNNNSENQKIINKIKV